MKLTSVVVALLLICFYSILSTNCSVPHIFKCENKNKLSWLWNLRNNNRCLSIVVGKVIIPKCFFDQIFNSKFVIRVNDLEAIKYRNILSFQRTNCDSFLIFTENSKDIFELFQETNRTVKRFIPFSQLFLINSDPNIEFDQQTLEYIYKNGLFVYVVKNTPSMSDVLTFSTLRNVLTNKILNLSTTTTNDVITYFGNYKNHPVLNSEYKEKTFRVSLFSCSPYVTYVNKGSFDGIEYRVLKEITKDWSIKHSQCDTSKEIRDPYAVVRGQVENHQSDLGMCSVWLNEKSNTYLDVTSYVNFECATFLVPKPQNLNPATYLYKSINVGVGYSIVVSLITIPLICTIFARTGKKLLENSWHDLVYLSFIRCTIITFGVITSQSIAKFPKQNSMKLVLIGWVLVSFLFGIVFSTGYTSLLTKAPSTKPIDTVVDFLDNGLVYDRKGKSNLAKAFSDTGIDIYIQLSKRNIGDNGTDTSKNAMENNKLKLAHFTKILSNDYLTDITSDTDPDFKLRLMKSCLFNYYTVLALQKHSSYTQYFREKIGMLQQFGVISHWRSSIEGANNNYMRPYFKKVERTTEPAKKISLENLGGAFWLVLSGNFMATIVLLAEHLVNNWQRLNKLQVETF